MGGRIILQDLGNRLYLGSDGAWANSCQAAKLFEHTYLALLEGLNHAGKHLQVVRCFQNPGANMYMPVHPVEELNLVCCEKCPFFDSSRPDQTSVPANSVV